MLGLVAASVLLGHLINHVPEQAVIATVQVLRASGLSYRAIADELNRRGLVNWAGGRFTHTQVVRMLEARRMSRGPRMDPVLYHALKEKIQSLDTMATRMPLPDGTSPTTMKSRMSRVAAELNIPVTVRKIPGGRIFWRSTAEDLQQATEVAQRLRTPQRPGRTRPGRHLRAESTRIMHTVTTAPRNQYDDHPSARRHMVWNPPRAFSPRCLISPSPR